jgi:hypothetical protein
MADYKNGMIYIIKSSQTDEAYIGSTIQKLSRRLSDHKKKYKKFLDNKYTYCTSFEIVKYDDAYIELYEEYPCNSKLELESREAEIITLLKCVNIHIPIKIIKKSDLDYFIWEHLTEYITDDNDFYDTKTLLKEFNLWCKNKGLNPNTTIRQYGLILNNKFKFEKVRKRINGGKNQKRGFKINIKNINNAKNYLNKYK